MRVIAFIENHAVIDRIISYKVIQEFLNAATRYTEKMQKLKGHVRLFGLIHRHLLKKE